jgi:restriction endonuclease S subunit
MLKVSRLDAQYAAHQAEQWLAEIETRNKPVSLSSILEFIGSGHTPYKHDITQGDVRFITVECVSDLILDNDKLKRITSQQFEEEFQTKRITQNSIVCTIKRRICKAFPFLEPINEPLALNQDIALLKPIKDVSAAYLATYLCCKVGQTYADKQKTEQMNPYISVANLATLPIIILSKPFQTRIESLVKSAHAALEDSKRLYADAEALLLTELGLPASFHDKEASTVAVKSFRESFGATGRLDAEYYQPKYDALYSQIKMGAAVKGWAIRRLGELSEPLKYGSSAQLEYIAEGVPFLRIADLQQYRFDAESVKYISPQAAAEEQSATVQTGDVLISRSGTLGLSIDIPSDFSGAVFGSYFIRTRPKHQNLNPAYLALYLNSTIGQMQTEQSNTGGVQTNLTIPVIESLRIVCPPLEIQKMLTEKVHQSYRNKDHSKHLLSLAKRAVETAIESGEVAGVALLAAEGA